MKKYIRPSVKVVVAEAEELLSGSGVMSENGIQFGGTDSGGTLEPSAKSHTVWEE